MNIKEEAENYTAPETKNISDLQKVSTSVEIEDREYEKKDGEKFSLKVITVDGEQYRVPTSVLKALKTILEDKPELEFFKVKKEGTGMNTTYVVIPL